MAVTLSENQSLLKDMVTRFVAEEYGFEQRRRVLDSADGIDTDFWTKLADLGLFGAGLPESDGGFGGGAVETALVMEQFGRGLVLEPYLSTAVIGAGVIARYAKPARRDDLLAAILAGAHRVALAYAEPAGRFDPYWVTAQAVAGGDGYLLSGAKCAVWDGAVADTLLVSARTSGEPGDTAGLTLFLVDADRAGVQRRNFRTYDGQRVSEIEFEVVVLSEAEVIGTAGQGAEVLDWALDQAAVAQCAEAVGAMDALFEMLLEYLKTREQFGKPIGKFQALQHRAADMYMALENARALTYRAAALLADDGDDDDDSDGRRQAVSAAKVTANDAAALIGREGLQMHGAIGITDEYPASHYFKRLEASESRFGDSEYHLGRFIAEYPA